MRPGDNKWSVTIWARNPETGDAKWAYQIEPHDAWDYDEIMENILVDMPWQGKIRKLLLHPGRTGFMFVLDRANRRIIVSRKLRARYWSQGYDLKTGLPVDNEQGPHTGISARVCPSSTGGKEFVPSAFSPRPASLHSRRTTPAWIIPAPQSNYIAGTPYLGASVHDVSRARRLPG